MTPTNDTTAEHARAVWFLGLVAKRMRTRPNGIAVVFLPSGYVDALRELTATPAPPTDPTPSPGRRQAAYLAACGAAQCTNNDVWETDAHGSPCPVCGNSDGNVYDSVADLLAASEEDLFGPAIHVYTRANAIADGQLVDVSAFGTEAGFGHPVALTAAAWQLTVAWSDDEPAIQDERGRLWDVVYMAADAARKRAGNELLFTVAVIPRGEHTPRTMQLKVHCGPGDDGQPVVTIMLPEES